MAQRVRVVYVDDIDNETTAAETVRFSLDGVNYEIDLGKENAAKMREDLDKWIAHARRVSGRKSTTRKNTGDDGPDPADVRVWARENGYEVSARGRVPIELRRAYVQAHS